MFSFGEYLAGLVLCALYLENVDVDEGQLEGADEG